MVVVVERDRLVIAPENESDVAWIQSRLGAEREAPISAHLSNAPSSAQPFMDRGSLSWASSLVVVVEKAKG